MRVWEGMAGAPRGSCRATDQSLPGDSVQMEAGAGFVPRASSWESGCGSVPLRGSRAGRVFACGEGKVFAESMGEVGALHGRVTLPALPLCLWEGGLCLLKVRLEINPWKSRRYPRCAVGPYVRLRVTAVPAGQFLLPR